MSLLFCEKLAWKRSFSLFCEERIFSFTLPPCCLSQVSANTENSSMSGYLNRSKGNKKQWKRLWFVIKNKVLYTYAASEVPTVHHKCLFFLFFFKI